MTVLRLVDLQKDIDGDDSSLLSRRKSAGLELNRFEGMPDGMRILSAPAGKEYYVYNEITERSRQVLYVGMGTGDRLNDHKKNAFKPSSDKTKRMFVS